MKLRRKAGAICMAAGVLLIAAAILLLCRNWAESDQAGEAAAEVLPTVRQAMESDSSEAEVDGETYIGVLTIPTLSLELPVMREWSYPKLKIAPCRYIGSAETDDLVICGHNYSRHFGHLKNLNAGDPVLFTGVDGVTNSYEVEEVETLMPYQVEEMIDSEYDLTLFTCTYGGQSRVTVRCKRA